MPSLIKSLKFKLSHAIRVDPHYQINISRQGYVTRKLINCHNLIKTLLRLTSCSYESDKMAEGVEESFRKKPGWLKRKIIWPIKCHVFRTFSFKVIHLFTAGQDFSQYMMPLAQDQGQITHLSLPFFRIPFLHSPHTLPIKTLENTLVQKLALTRKLFSLL